MSHIPQAEIERIQRETGMAQVQAYYHAKARHLLAERMARERAQRAAECVRRFATIKEQA